MPATLTQTFSSIASAIRNRGVSGTMTPAQMSTNISQVQNGNKYGVHIDGILGNIDENGVVYQESDDTMIDIYAPTIRQIPQGVMDNERGFPGNPNIRSVSMPNLTTVGVSALQRCFRNCSNLVSVDFSGLTSIPDGTNSNTGAFLYAFSGCTSLQTADFSSLQSIGNYGLYHAFAEDTNTTNIATNGAAASACSSLKNVDLSSLQSVGNSGMRFAFDGCTSLESIDLSNLTTIGIAALQYAFSNCTSLVEVDLSGLTTISSDTALQCAFEGCSSLTSVDLSNLTSVTGTSAITFLFQNCTALKRMDLSSLTSISSILTFASAFRGCTSLEYVDLSNLETTATGVVGSLMFRDCSSLKVVRLTKLMKTGISLPQSMFQNCTSLEVVDFSQASGVPTLTITSGNHAFSSAGSIYRIVVPDSLYDTWIATTGWSTIASHIVKSSEFYTSQIEYLEGTGTQYIDTGVSCQTNDVIEVEIVGQFTTTGSREYQYNGIYGGAYFGVHNSQWNAGNTDIGTANTSRHTFKMTTTIGSSKIVQLYIDGTKIGQSASRTVASGNIGLFSLLNSPTTYMCDMKCYGCKITKNSTLVRDMIPVRMIEEGCMYDKVNGVIYHNEGSGNFSTGNDTYMANTLPPNDKLKLVVETTADYKKSGIYSAERDDTSKPIVIDWGDGTVEQVNGDVSQKVHEYTSEGTFNVVVENIKSFAASINDQTWLGTTSQNTYTLKEVVAIPDSITSIGNNAFWFCESLTSVHIPDSVTSIGKDVFYYCSGLTSVTIPGSVTSIGSYAFSGCSGLTSVTIEEGVTSIGDKNREGDGSGVFSGCVNLTNIIIPSSVKYIGSDTFEDAPFYENIQDGLIIFGQVAYAIKGTPPNNITIPSNVVSITPFLNCQNSNITILGNIQHVGIRSFSYANSITFTNMTVSQVQTMVNSSTFEYSSSNSYTITCSDGSFTITTSCILKGTDILLADNTTKKIEDLTYDDALKVWDFDEGQLGSAKVCWLTKPGLTNNHYYQLTFDNGTVLKTTGINSNHRIFSVDQSKFTNVCDAKVGDKVFSIDGTLTITDVKYVEEECEYYNVMTSGKINCFANGILTSDRYGNLYPIVDMKYVKDGRTVRPYSEYEAVGIDRYWYDNLRLGENTETVEKSKQYVWKCIGQMLPIPN